MAGVYISYPFCNQKCTFCNFASGVSTADMKARYMRALLDEIRRERWSWRPETLYLGGGTPSLLQPNDLRTITDAVPSSALREFTLECAPGTVDAEKVKAWVAAGVNRVSLGVQSFVETELRRTGRRHTAQITAADIQLLRSAGISNVNVDLIAGLPGQTAATWEESLDWVERLRPPHVSVYLFEMDEDSRLGKEALLGGVRYGADLLPDDDAAASFYERAVERLRGMGIARYEISNFALPGFESAHNLKYWTLEPYRGFGLDAHSYNGGQRWGNPDDMERYLAGERGETTAAQPNQEHFFVGLRLSGGMYPSADEWTQFAEPIERWTRAGLLERSGGGLRLTDRGVLLSNEVLADFVEAAAEERVRAIGAGL